MKRFGLFTFAITMTFVLGIFWNTTAMTNDNENKSGLDLSGMGKLLIVRETSDDKTAYKVMHHISFDGTQISYFEKGTGPTVLLLHGYASSALSNWVAPRIVDALADAGLNVIAVDLRGHGQSGRPHNREAYENLAMVRDVQHLADALKIEQFDVVGYSMGSTIAMWLALEDARVRRLVVAGHGDTITLDKWTGADHVAAGLLADSEEGLDETQIGYRRFIENEGGDFVALARVAQTDKGIPAERVKEVTMPTLILTGIDDDMVGPVDGLAAALPNATVSRPPGDHLTAPLQPAFTDALVEFLKSK